MRHFLIASVVGICFWGCSQPSADRLDDSTAPRVEVETADALLGDYIIGTPVAHENLAILPILSQTPKNDDRFITLDEGLKAGTVKIIEVGAEDGASADASDAGAPDEPRQEAVQQSSQIDGTVDRSQADDEPQQDTAAQVADGQSGDTAEQPFGLFGGEEVDGEVNKLLVLNTSGRPLYLMPGEVISGGKQDRTIGQEVAIDSSEKPVPIDVFCVEHGRWAGRSVPTTSSQLAAAADFDSSLSLVVSETATVEELAEEAKEGKFVASVGQLNKDARLAVQEAGAQEKVWEEVAKTNSKVGNDSESSNFAAAYLSGEIAKDLQPFIKKLEAIGGTKQIVGVAVAVNGKVISVDVFESTPLFKKFWPKLLKSYALDAVSATGEMKPGVQPKVVAAADCIAFLKEVAQTPAVTEEVANGQKLAKRRSLVGTSFTYYDAKAAEQVGVTNGSAGRGVGGAFGGGVHTSVLAQ
jgi:hypothetical protein